MSIYMGQGWWGRPGKVSHFFPNAMAETSACNRDFDLDGWLSKQESTAMKRCTHCTRALQAPGPAPKGGE